MPRAERYSESTMQLAADLGRLGHRVGCSALETWARRGLAPRPARVHRGRLGTTSRYPEGALEQYTAVASVMRRGRDWRLSGLMLIGRGFLPTEEETTRSLLRYMTSGIPIPADAQNAGEAVVSAAEGDPHFAPLLKLAETNLAAAGVMDRTGRPASVPDVARGAMANTMTVMFGGRFSTDDAVAETAAAAGLHEPGISSEERNRRERYVEAFFEDVYNFEELRAYAEVVNPVELQSTIRRLLPEVPEYMPAVFHLFRAAGQDVVMVAVGLTATRIQDLGGSAWLDRAAADVSYA